MFLVIIHDLHSKLCNNNNIVLSYTILAVYDTDHKSRDDYHHCVIIVNHVYSLSVYDDLFVDDVSGNVYIYY